MGTKSNPGKWDCYAKAKPDEPLFVLMARDPLAPILVDLWAQLAVSRAVNGAEKSVEAIACANAMREWFKENVQPEV